MKIARIALLVAIGAAATAANARAQTATVVVKDAWVRATEPSKMESAAYMTIENSGAEKRAVVGVTADQAKVAEMHNMTMDGKLMKMVQIPKIDVPAKGKASLKPNAMHIMLMGLTTKLAVGDKVTGTLKLDDGTTVPFTAEVRK